MISSRNVANIARALFLKPFSTPFAKPVRHQVFDLPVIVPIKEEYRCHSLLCQCGHSTAAVLPEHVAQSNFGPRTHAAIAYLASVHRVTRRGIAEIMQSLFGTHHLHRRRLQCCRTCLRGLSAGGRCHQTVCRFGPDPQHR